MAFSLFGRKEPKKDPEPILSPSSLPRAVAFVDYESWYVSLKTTYAIAPDIKGWFEELNSRYQLIDVIFFADFSHRSLENELRRIRPYTNKIIDTRSPNGVEKDYTDFIILDNIYQKALSSNDIQTFILFSGDGHFSSVVSFLKNFYHKNVVVYAIRDCFSAQLQEAASETHTLPDEKQVSSGLHLTVFEYLRRAQVPTYDGALQAVLQKHQKVNRKTAERALELLEKDSVLSQRTIPGNRQKQLFVDWDRAAAWLDVPLEEFMARELPPLRQDNGRGGQQPSPERHSGDNRPPHFVLKESGKQQEERKDGGRQEQNRPKQQNRPEQQKQKEPRQPAGKPEDKPKQQEKPADKSAEKNANSNSGTPAKKAPQQKVEPLKAEPKAEPKAEQPKKKQPKAAQQPENKEQQKASAPAEANGKKPSGEAGSPAAGRRKKAAAKKTEETKQPAEDITAESEKEQKTAGAPSQNRQGGRKKKQNASDGTQVKPAETEKTPEPKQEPSAKNEADHPAPAQNAQRKPRSRKKKPQEPVPAEQNPADAPAAPSLPAKEETEQNKEQSGEKKTGSSSGRRRRRSKSASKPESGEGKAEKAANPGNGENGGSSGTPAE